MFLMQNQRPAGKVQTRMCRSKKKETQVVGWCSDTEAMIGMWIFAYLSTGGREGFVNLLLNVANKTNQHWRHSSPKNENCHYSPSCRSKPIRPSFLFRTQRYFWWNSRAFWPCIVSNATDTFKAQKGSKDIIKIAHVTKTDTGENCWIKFFLFSLSTKSILVTS